MKKTSDKDKLFQAYNILSELHADWDDTGGQGLEELEALENVMDRIDELTDRVVMSEKWGRK